MTFTKQQLLELNPCCDGLAFAESCGFDFAKIYETCERGDWLIWLLRKTNTITKPQAVLLACECAEHALAIYEKKYPSDKRPRQAIEAARKWASNPTEKNRAKCRTAYADADAAAAAAYAADADAAAAAARTSERKWQANKIREIIPNPFK